jgi:hypothetical protein
MYGNKLDKLDRINTLQPRMASCGSMMTHRKGTAFLSECQLVLEL